MFSRRFLVDISAVKTFIVNRCPRTITIVLFCRMNRFFRSLTIGHSEGSVSSLVSVHPSSTAMEEGKRLVAVSPRGISVNRVVVMGPNRGVPLSNIMLSKSSVLSAETLAKRSIPEDIRGKSRTLSNYVGRANILVVGAAGTFNRSATSGVVSLIRGTSDQGTPARGFVAAFTHCCAPIIMVLTTFLTVLPPVVLNKN